MSLDSIDGKQQSVMPFIDGRACESQSEVYIEVTNPSSERNIAYIPSGSLADVDLAVASARRAFSGGLWSDAPPSFRRKTLGKLAEIIADECQALDALDAGEMGKPISEPFGNARSAARILQFYADGLDKITGDVYCSDKSSFVSQRRVPRGVIAAIVPWNFPTVNCVLKFAPALAAGNCMVLKPSELSSRSAVHIARMAVQAGLPPGVLNVVPGIGEIVGSALGRHMDVDMLTFTGSTEVGKLMLQYAGQSNMKIVMAECGGKSPHVVFDDGVDIGAICHAIASRLVTNQGQICSVGSRLLVQRSIEKVMIQKIAENIGRIVMGDALHPETTFGPLASSRQCERVISYIESAVSDGAELIAGGRRTTIGGRGYFVEPTILRPSSSTARIAQEEIFGPVLTVIPFDNEAEAVSIANNTIYGLMAYVWTSDISTGMRVAKGIRSSVRVNAVVPAGEGAGHMPSSEPAGHSGVGVEGGLAGMESYMRRQLIAISHG